MSRYSSSSSLPGAKLETSFGILGEEPETKLVIKQISPNYLSKNHNTLLTPSSASSNGSGNSRIGAGRERTDSVFLPNNRDSSGGSRSSMRSSGSYVPVGGSATSYQFNAPCAQRYTRFLDRKQRTISASTLQSSSSRGGGSEADTSSPDYSQRVSSSSSNNSSKRGESSGQEPGPRTCPDHGLYMQQVSKSCVSLLNNVVARSNTVKLLPQPLYSMGGRTTSQTSGSAISGLSRTSPNSSASSYDTACSHISNNRDSVNLSSASNNKSSVGSIGMLNSNTRSSAGSMGMLNSRGDSNLSSSVFGSGEVKRTSPGVDVVHFNRRLPSSGDVFHRPAPFVDDFSQLRRRNKNGSLGSMSSSESLQTNTRFQRKAPVLCLQESYRMAVEGDRALATPVGKSLFGKKSLRKSESSPS